MKNSRIVVWMAVAALAVPALNSANGQKQRARSSPPYTVLVNLRFSSPFVPDGRMSLAEFAASVTFKNVVFEYDPEDNLLFDSLFCHVEADEGTGTVSECRLNDVEPESPRHRAHFIKPPPERFAALLEVESQELEPGGLPLIPISAPEEVRLCFRTLFGRDRIVWGATEGSAELEELELRFDVPWLKLLRGEPVSVSLDYKGNWPEDSGKWWIEFLPVRPKKMRQLNPSSTAEADGPDMVPQDLAYPPFAEFLDDLAAAGEGQAGGLLWKGIGRVSVLK